jgi:hypothetical protein
MRKRDHWEELGIDGRIILKWILNTMEGLALDSFGSGQELVHIRCTNSRNEEQKIA